MNLKDFEEIYQALALKPNTEYLEFVKAGIFKLEEVIQADLHTGVQVVRLLDVLTKDEKLCKLWKLHQPELMHFS